MAVSANFFIRFFRGYRKCVFKRTFSKTSMKFGVTPPNLSQTKPKIEELYLNSRVQGILKKLSGVDYEKVFSVVHQKLSIPRYEFATETRLENLRKSTELKAQERLQMPPVMEQRQAINESISYDPELQSFEENKILFIDISQNVPERERVIVAREPNGTLRHAYWDERFRMNQTYFPRPGRKLIVPEYFDSPYLESVLEAGSYEFLLDSACAQLDPDDPAYHKVVYATYEHINTCKKFNNLRSTRHFGPMAFYLSWKQKIELLLVDMIERDLIDDAADLVKLRDILHPELRSMPEDELSPLEIVTKFVDMTTSSYKAHLELALQTSLENKTFEKE